MGAEDRKTITPVCRGRFMAVSKQKNMVLDFGLFKDEMPLREVARLLGNSEAMVEQVYGKHSPNYLRRAVTALSIPKPKTLDP